MARHFGAQHVANGYAAMGNALGRPRYAGVRSRSVAQAIAAAKAAEARAAKIRAGSKKK